MADGQCGVRHPVTYPILRRAHRASVLVLLPLQLLPAGDSILADERRPDRRRRRERRPAPGRLGARRRPARRAHAEPAWRCTWPVTPTRESSTTGTARSSRSTVPAACIRSCRRRSAVTRPTPTRAAASSAQRAAARCTTGSCVAAGALPSAPPPPRSSTSARRAGPAGPVTSARPGRGRSRQSHRRHHRQDHRQQRARRRPGVAAPASRERPGPRVRRLHAWRRRERARRPARTAHAVADEHVRAVARPDAASRSAAPRVRVRRHRRRRGDRHERRVSPRRGRRRRGAARARAARQRLDLQGRRRRPHAVLGRAQHRDRQAQPRRVSRLRPPPGLGDRAQAGRLPVRPLPASPTSRSSSRAWPSRTSAGSTPGC